MRQKWKGHWVGNVVKNGEEIGKRSEEMGNRRGRWG